MKKTVLIFAVLLTVISVIVFCVNFRKNMTAGIFMTYIEALAAGESTGYSCTVTTNCVTGSVQCTGTKQCSRTAYSVTCDGHTTEC